MRYAAFAGYYCALMLLFGFAQTNITVDNADLLYLQGPGEVTVINGTEIYRLCDEETGTWRVLFSRSLGQSSIVFSAQSGLYQAAIWSIPADMANPVRQKTETTYNVGGPTGPVDVLHVLALFANWGPCSGLCTWDLNGDGVVDVMDLLVLFSYWGQPLP